MPEVEERLDRLDELVAQTQIMLKSLSYEVSRTQIQIDNVTRNVNSLSHEIKDFKTHTQSSFERMNRKWEELVRKQGTLVEDMVAPNMKFIAEKYFNREKSDCQSFAIRFEKKHPKIQGREKEFDVIALYPNKVIVNETKFNPKLELAVKFIDFIKSGEFFEYFPEYKGKELIPVFASFHIPDNVIKKLSKNKIYAMGIREDTMDILNPEL